MGLGAGCIKVNVSPLISEQYQGKLRKETLPSGEVVIKSPAVTIQSIYMCTSLKDSFLCPVSLTSSWIDATKCL